MFLGICDALLLIMYKYAFENDVRIHQHRVACTKKMKIQRRSRRMPDQSRNGVQPVALRLLRYSLRVPPGRL